MKHDDQSGFLRDLAAGDSDCLECVCDRFRRMLVGIVAAQVPRKLNRRVDAQDIVQEALIAFTLGVRENQYHFADTEDVEHLLVAITLNRMRRVLRHEHAAKRDVDCEDSDIKDVADSGHRAEALDLSHDPLEQLLASDLLREVLESLPEKDRQIIQYLRMRCTHEEAAKRAGCGTRHVDQVLAKARRRLEELEEED